MAGGGESRHRQGRKGRQGSRGKRQRSAPRPLGPAPGITVTIKGGGKDEASLTALEKAGSDAGKLFAAVTGVEATDYYHGEDRSLFVVAAADYQQATSGSKAAKMALLREKLGHPVETIGTADTPEGFARNLFAPFKPEAIEVIEAPMGTIVHVSLPIATKGRAIGKAGSRLRAVRELLARQHQVKELVVT